jgi:ADP-L-glycero-D-manno-heptose 6-epimerase
MIVITGGAGFIGSALVWQLNQSGINDILIVDELGCQDKWKNLSKRQFTDIIHIDNFIPWITASKDRKIEAIVHMGACSTTTEVDADFLLKNNVHYSMSLFEYCAAKQIPFIYASSAATYGQGELGYVDDPEQIPLLRPINKYGYSKQLFDGWALKQKKTPPFWIGLKFFNVYGPQEYHKGAQASVILHAFPQIREHKKLKLFKSYKEDVAHGEQKRDFIYVKDAVKIMEFLLKKKSKRQSGIYNFGTGLARTFVDLGTCVFHAMELNKPKFEWIDMPEALQLQYQYFTAADMRNLRTKIGYKDPFYSLEEGVQDYVRNYLLTEDPYL